MKEKIKQKIRKLERELEEAQIKDYYLRQLKLGDKLRNLEEELKRSSWQGKEEFVRVIRTKAKKAGLRK